MLVFMDVGSHEGQTLEEAVKPEYGFDRIYAFEPMPREFAILQERFGSDPRVILCNYGLSDTTGTLDLYGDNENMGTSLYAAKVDVDESIVTQCKFVRASEFVRDEISDDDRTIVKLNCEGGEIPILTDLLDFGQIGRLTHVMIDFDSRKIAGLEHREGELTKRMKRAGVDYIEREHVMLGETHQERIGCWLKGVL